MSYLKNQVLASAPALFVICRYLAHHPPGATVDRMNAALAPASLSAEVGRAGRTAKVPPVLSDSLQIGVDIGLLNTEGVRDRRVYTLRHTYVEQIRDMPPADSRAFRTLLLRRFGVRLLDAVEKDEPPPDMPYAITWLLMWDPLRSTSDQWDQGPREKFEQAGMRQAVYNPEQWRPFLRWARALGLVSMTVSRNKSRVSVDPTCAVEGLVGQMPSSASAQEWLDRLYELAPLLGDPRLLRALPDGISLPPGPTEAVSLALLKLERANRVRLMHADDFADAVVLRVGGRDRRIARIEIVEERP
ncbi:hypothetical protein AB0A74_18460 [Saccharothrix sp. NPDC042600]|uniref:hypothetical protein n=1 Tax=Saccharothrix TaxID=2071 RepID=UPI0033D42F33|nr:hypothetical protein GCM10017745_51820 [Saccharothrix mutabilis subsp. capreolus]